MPAQQAIGKAHGTAVSLIATITKYEFIVSLCTLAPTILTVLNEVSEHLQKVKINLLETHNLVSTLKTEYTMMRTNVKLEEGIRSAQKFAASMDIPTELKEPPKRKVPKRLDDGTRQQARLSGQDTMKVLLCYFGSADYRAGNSFSQGALQLRLLAAGQRRMCRCGEVCPSPG